MVSKLIEKNNLQFEEHIEWLNSSGKNGSQFEAISRKFEKLNLQEKIFQNA